MPSFLPQSKARRNFTRILGVVVAILMVFAIVTSCAPAAVDENGNPIAVPTQQVNMQSGSLTLVGSMPMTYVARYTDQQTSQVCYVAYNNAGVDIDCP